jgi:aminopeptidase-like protein
MDFVTPQGLQGAYEAHQKIIAVIEGDCTPVSLVLCEPKMSDRGLRPTIGKMGSASNSRDIMNLIAYADGNHSLLEIAEIINVPAWELRTMAETLASFGIIDMHYGLTSP